MGAEVERLILLTETMLIKFDEAIKYLKLLEVKEEELPETIAEVYEPTATTKEEEIFSPIDKHRKKRLYWTWLYVKNTGATNSCKIGINGDTEGGFTLEHGEERTLGFKDLKIKYIRYKAVTDTTTIQFIPMRPRSGY